jgi:hypothetical protein
MPDQGRLVDEHEMRGVGKQIRLPWSKAIEIAVKSLKIRFGRSLVTTASIVLAIAFLMSILTGTTLVGSLRTRPARRVYWAGKDAELAQLQTNLDIATATTARLTDARSAADLPAAARDRIEAELERARTRRDELAAEVAAAKTEYERAGRVFALTELPAQMDLEAIRQRRDEVQKLSQAKLSSSTRPVVESRRKQIDAEYEIAVRSQAVRKAEKWIGKLGQMSGDVSRMRAELGEVSAAVRNALAELKQLDAQLADPAKASEFASPAVQRLKREQDRVRAELNSKEVTDARRVDLRQRRSEIETRLRDLVPAEIRRRMQEIEQSLPELLRRERAAALERQRRVLAEQPKTNAITAAEKRLAELREAGDRLQPPGNVTRGALVEAEARIKQTKQWLGTLDERDPRRPEFEGLLDELTAAIPGLREDARPLEHADTLGQLAVKHGGDAVEAAAAKVNGLAAALADLAAAQFPATARAATADERLWELRSELLIPDLRREARQATERALKTERLRARKQQMDTSERMNAALPVARDVTKPERADAARKAVADLEARLALRDLPDEERSGTEKKLVEARAALAALYRAIVRNALAEANETLAAALRTRLNERLTEARAELAYLEKTEPSRIDAERRRWPALAARVQAEEARAEWLSLWRDLQSGGYTSVPREITSAPADPSFFELLAKYMDPRDQWLALLASLVCFVGILNAMLMSVHERFREIGTMKCLGALESFIVKLYFLESSFIGIVGTLMGIGVGFVLTLLRASFAYGVETTFGNLDFGGVMLSAVGTLLIGALLSVGAAIFPAVSAAKMEPVDAMRVEE